MSYVLLRCSHSDNDLFLENAQITVDFTCLNGSLKITRIRGKYDGNTEIYDSVANKIYIKINGETRPLLLDSNISFGSNEYSLLYSKSDSDCFIWDGLTDDMVYAKIIMPESSAIFSESEFDFDMRMNWTEHTITYDANGGEGTPSPTTGLYSKTTYLSSQKPTRIGYGFLGWDTSPDSNMSYKYSSGSGIVITSDITLYAVWKEKSGKDKVVTVESLASLHKYNKETYIPTGRKDGSTIGKNSVAINTDCTASSENSFASGSETVASAYASHAEGNKTEATRQYSHAEGCLSVASGESSHAEGYRTSASADHAHAEGRFTISSGIGAHAEGSNTRAIGYGSHAEGYETTAASDYQHVQGKYNIPDVDENGAAINKYAHIVGNGKYNNPSNAHTLDWTVTLGLLAIWVLMETWFCLLISLVTSFLKLELLAESFSKD